VPFRKSVGCKGANTGKAYCYTIQLFQRRRACKILIVLRKYYRNHPQDFSEAVKKKCHQVSYRKLCQNFEN
jgi:hypothetical protein